MPHLSRRDCGTIPPSFEDTVFEKRVDSPSTPPRDPSNEISSSHRIHRNNISSRGFQSFARPFKCLFDRRNLSTDRYRFFSKDIPLFFFYIYIRFDSWNDNRAETWTFLFVGGIGREDKLVAAFSSAIRWFVERASGRRKF